MSLFVPVKIVPDDPKFIPQYQTAGAANADLVANVAGEIMLGPMDRASFDTGFRIQLPAGWKAEISMRSGWAARGLVLVNFLILPNEPGQLDSDFRGRVRLNVINLGSDWVTIDPGDRIAQIWPTPVYRFAWQVVTELDETERGEGGHGSTGR